MMPFTTVRPAHPDDYAAAARVLTLAQPDDPISTTDLAQLMQDQARWG